MIYSSNFYGQPSQIYRKKNAKVRVEVSNHQLISLRFSTKFVFFRAYLVILS